MKNDDKYKNIKETYSFLSDKIIKVPSVLNKKLCQPIGRSSLTQVIRISDYSRQSSSGDGRTADCVLYLHRKVKNDGPKPGLIKD